MKTKIPTYKPLLVALLTALVALPATPPYGSLQTFLAQEATNRAYIYSQIGGGPFPAPVLGANLSGMQDLYFGYNQRTGTIPFSLNALKAQVDMIAGSRSNGWYGVGYDDRNGALQAGIALHSGAAGTAYAVNDVIALSQGNAYGATILVNTVSSGAISTWTLLTPGSGYGTAMGVSVTGGSGTGAQFDINNIYLPGLGASVININIDPWYFVDNAATNTASMRSTFDSVMSYILTTYPGVQVSFNSGFTVDDLSQASNGTMYGCNSGFGNTMPVAIPSPQALATCVTAPLGWLALGGMSYSAYQYIIRKYTASGSYGPNFIRRFIAMHEPLTVNNNYGPPTSGTPWATVPTSSSPGSGSDWKSAFSTMIGDLNMAIAATGAATKVCLGFSNREQAWQTYGITAPNPPACIGYDSFSDNLASTNGDLGNIKTMIGNAQSLGMETFASEIGPPAWAIPGMSTSDGNSYWGVGACNLLSVDIWRQSMIADSLFFAYVGTTEIGYFDLVSPATWCLNISPSNPNSAQTISSTYFTAVANNYAHRTPLFWIAYDLFGWPFGQVGGTQLAAEGGRRPI